MIVIHILDATLSRSSTGGVDWWRNTAVCHQKAGKKTEKEEELHSTQLLNLEDTHNAFW